jgi:diguanylate cyclase (GGDEF)-like protein/PAS domain S-box-containing protein
MTCSFVRRICLLAIVAGTFMAREPLAASANGEASNRQREARIGVLAFRSPELTEQQWTPLAKHLSRQIPGTGFKVVPLHVDAVEAAIRTAAVDFLLVNPEPYVTLAPRYRMAAIATLMPLAGGRPVSRFGGVILVRADRNELRSFEDVVGRGVAAASEKSFAGFLVQKWALGKEGVDLDQAASIRFTDLPQDRVVTAVLDGTADFGFVRTGLLESLQREGKVPKGALRALWPSHRTAEQDEFPQALSTDLYPEWPFVALSHVPEPLAKEVALTLLHLDPGHPAAAAANIYGFAPPGDYASIEALLLRLRAHPDRLAMFGAAEVVQKYAIQIVGAALVLVLVAAVAIVRTRRQNKRLAAALAETRRLAQREELLDSLSEGVYGVDPAGNCSFINDAALTVLGYRAEEIVGADQHAIFHHHYPDGSPYPARECPVRRTLNDGERRSGEEVFFQRDGTPLPVRFAVRAVRRDGAIVGAVVAFQDIRDEKAASEKIRDLALHDPLTGLANRRLFWDRLEVELARSTREAQRGAVLFIDLDGFKSINDRYGHDSGDQVLVEIARRLREIVRAVDAVGRIGGDEFVVIIAATHDAADALGVAEKLRLAVGDPVTDTKGVTHRVTASIGVAEFPVHGRDPATLVHHADLAMYEAKRRGKNCCVLWPGAAADGGRFAGTADASGG